jgi:hypothetical protein
MVIYYRFYDSSITPCWHISFSYGALMTNKFFLSENRPGNLRFVRLY